MNHLDECSFCTVLDEHVGIAGLAFNSRCMLPWKVEMKRRVADHFSTCKEPNSFNMPYCEMRTNWEDEMFQHGRSSVTVPSMEYIYLSAIAGKFLRTGSAIDSNKELRLL